MDFGVRVSVEVAMTSPALQAMDGTIAKVDYTLPGINKPPTLHQMLLGVRTAMKAVQEQIGENGVGLRLATIGDHGFAEPRDLHWPYGNPLGTHAVVQGGGVVYYGSHDECLELTGVESTWNGPAEVVELDAWLAEQEAASKA